MNNRHPWQQAGKFFTALPIFLNQLDRDAGLLQQIAQIVRRIAAACQHHGSNLVGKQVNLFKEVHSICRCCNNGNQILCLQYHVSIRNEHLIAPFNGADQHVTMQPCGNLLHGIVLQHTSGWNSKLQQFNFSLSKCINLNGRRKPQHPCNFTGSCIFRIDYHGKTEFFL